MLCPSPVINEPCLVVHVISPATGHLHVLCLQPVRLPASCHHFCPLNTFSSFSFKFKLCFPREAFPDLFNPCYMLLEYRFLLLFSAITTSVLHEIEWLMIDVVSASFTTVWVELCLFVLTTVSQVIMMVHSELSINVC